MSEPVKPSGPDLTAGVEASAVPEGGMLVGQADGEAVLLVKADGEVCALAATCTHYGAPLADGVVVGRTVRCPWHHACFDVKTGEAVGPPALRPLDTWGVVTDGARVRVTRKRPAQNPTPAPVEGPKSVLVVGAGAAGDAAAEMLRRLGYRGGITLLSRDNEGPPVDRPNLSKDYLAGTAPEEWIPLRGSAYYESEEIALRPGAEVVKVDVAAKQVKLAGGEAYAYGALLLATGATPSRLPIPGADRAQVHTLRTLGDARAIVAAAATAKRAVVLGASFIGLEVAASLRKRGLEVHVVGREAVPLAHVLGPELGALVRSLHEEQGVVFHLGTTPGSIGAAGVELHDGTKLGADLVVMGVGVRPNTALAEAAGLAVDRGVVVDARMRTSAPDVYAAGDIARFPFAGESARIEHWAVAQRHGQAAARAMLGLPAGAPWVPFFWSQHYDLPINYVGHAEGWDALTIAGSVEKRDCLVAYRRAGRVVAVATVYRDQASLCAEDALARGDQGALEEIAKG